MPFEQFSRPYWIDQMLSYFLRCLKEKQTLRTIFKGSGLLPLLSAHVCLTYLIAISYFSCMVGTVLSFLFAVTPPSGALCFSSSLISGTTFQNPNFLQLSSLCLPFNEPARFSLSIYLECCSWKHAGTLKSPLHLFLCPNALYSASDHCYFTYFPSTF